jgi:hypothetical protein
MRSESALCWPNAAAIVGVLFAGAAGACALVLDSGKYHAVETDAHAGDVSVGACSPGQDRRSLENACTSAACVPYSGTLPTCAGGLCPLPSPSAAADGAPTASDAGNSAGPDTPCATVRPNPNDILFVTGSTALKGFIQEVSKVLATQPTNPVTVVYQASGSCVGVKAAIDPGNNPLVASAGATTYYDANGNAQTCTIDRTHALVADVGASDVFYSTCYMGEMVTPTLPQDIADNFGPVQIMNFAVPQGSSQRSISLNAAYYIFGFGGGAYPVPPWTDPMELQIRSAASGTQSMIAAAIGVPAAQWRGVGNATSGEVGNALVAAGQSNSQAIVDSALGILASDYLVQNSDALRGLAVKDENSTCAYYPSSSATSRDNANARDGHYPLWGPSHFYVRVNGQTRVPSKPGATQFIDGLSGVTPLPGLDLIAEYASKGLVPLCAMHVSRNNDGGGYQHYTPPTTCNCYFDLIATGANACKLCSTNADCPTDAPNCNRFGPAPQQGNCDL